MIAAPTQQDRAAWHGTRIGRFTASRFGALMTQPRSKADRDAGKCGAVAMAYITAKAVERLTGVPMDDGEDKGFAARRGLLLEPAALHILNKVWRQCDPCTWQAYGDNLGSTPDALVDNGKATMDLKCPANPVDVVRFADEVIDGDFDTLLGWDTMYAWQIMVQALTTGCGTAHLVYFTDRLPVYKLDHDELHEAQTLIDQRAEQYSQESIYPWSYTYASDGYYYAAKTFTLTDEIAKQITDKLERCEAECVNIMHKIKALLNQ